MRRLGIGLGVVVLLAAVVWWMIGSDWRRLILSAPSDSNVLFWTQDQREAGFRMMDRVPMLVTSRPIPGSDALKELPAGPEIDFGFDMDAYIAAQKHAAIVILHKGDLRYEGYGLDFDSEGRWTSFSVAKSFTSTLVGAAIVDGYIGSLQDSVSQYIPGLQGSAYDDVTIEQLLTMTSGVRWNEDYEDPASDVALFNDHVSDDGSSNIVSYMSQLPRAHPPGQVWNYSTGETNMIGDLVRSATGKTLASYLSEKVWGPYGMQQDASWLLNEDGSEISGCCIQAATRDFARFGQFILEGAEIDGQSIVPAGWIEAATVKQADIGVPGEGYGYQWWTYDDGAFAAQGIFGQGIFIDPNRDLIIATNGSWRSALGIRDGEAAAREALFKTVQAAIDAETLSGASASE